MGLLRQVFAEIRGTNEGRRGFWYDGKAVGIAKRIAICLIAGGDIGYKVATAFVALCYAPLRRAVLNVRLGVLNGGTVLHAICGNRPFYASDGSFPWEISPDSLSEQVDLAVGMWMMLRRQGAEIVPDNDGCLPWDKESLEYLDEDFVLQMAICKAIGQLEPSRTAKLSCTAEQNSAGVPVSSMLVECPEECTETFGSFFGFNDTDDYETFELDGGTFRPDDDEIELPELYSDDDN